MKTAFIHRLGAFGDIVHCTHLPRLIKEHYKVDKLYFETSARGHIALQQNPYIDVLTVHDERLDDNTLITKWNYLKDEYDLVFNLINTIEIEYCTSEHDQRYYRNNAYRRGRCGNLNFYDVMTEACNLPENYYGTRGELYYPAKEHGIAQRRIAHWKKEYDCDWFVMVCLSGSSPHKRFQCAESICRKILEKYPKTLIILTGDKYCLPDVFKHPRVFSEIEKWNLRTTALFVKYVDFYIGPETGLTCVANLWDTPSLQLLTAANWVNHIKGAKNAWWVQSDAPCSPCHKNSQKYYGCTIKDNLPLCVMSFSEDKIMAKVEEAYVNRKNVTESTPLVPAEVPIVQGK